MTGTVDYFPDFTMVKCSCNHPSCDRYDIPQLEWMDGAGLHLEDAEQLIQLQADARNWRRHLHQKHGIVES